MMCPDAAKKKDLRAILQQVLGFSRKSGRGEHLLRPYGGNEADDDYMLLALHFQMRIIYGEEPSIALENALAGLPVKQLGRLEKRDDQTLMVNIAKRFGLTSVPQSNDEWRRKTLAWHLKFKEAIRELLP